jgi:hypothetical protein
MQEPDEKLGVISPSSTVTGVLDFAEKFGGYNYDCHIGSVTIFGRRLLDQGRSRPAQCTGITNSHHTSQDCLTEHR